MATSAYTFTGSKFPPRARTLPAELAKLRQDYAALQARYVRKEKPLDLTADAPPELARILSHELRTPLVLLLALPDLLAEQGSLPSGVLNAYLRDVRKAGEHLKEVGDELTELLTPTRRDNLLWDTAGVQELLRRLEALCTPMAREAGVTLAVVSLASGTLVTAETSLLTALWRLVDNALTATPAGGRVELIARDVAPDDVAFAVRDFGRGMTEAEVQLAKLPFHQQDPMLRRSTTGMGLGLTLADRMAQRLGGKLLLESAPGAGTTASIVLPRKRAAAESP